MIMLLPKSDANEPAATTIVIQTVHGNRMSVSMDQLPHRARGGCGASADNDTAQSADRESAGSAK
jgi:hypothetical protein